MTGIVAKRFVLSRALSLLLLLGAQRGFSYTTSSDGEGPTCSNGLLGLESEDGSICCDVRCDQCGGDGCARPSNPDLVPGDCCTGLIDESISFCGFGVEAPCIIRGDCLDGVRGQLGRTDKPEAVCCPFTCPSCGGPDCGIDLPLGLTKEDCCVGAIVESQLNCIGIDVEAPCRYSLEIDRSAPSGLCFPMSDRGVLTDLVFELSSEDMTPERCFNNCQPLAFFGIMGGTECYCSNGEAATGDADFDGFNNDDDTFERSCDIPCPGDDSEQCGGEESISIYTIRFMFD